jgi:LETM1 and EF-hand domain-containing protein 1
MEFLLPVALKLFPNMLPSTFEDKFAAVSSLKSFRTVQLTFTPLLSQLGGETAEAPTSATRNGQVPAGNLAREWS